MSASFQVSGESILPPNGQDSKQSHKLKKTRAVSKSLKSTGRESTESKTSETSPIKTTGQLPLFPEGHRASRPVLPGSAEAEKMTAGSGRNLLASLNGFYQPGSWQRILLESLVLKTTWRSRNGLLAWKLKTMRSSHRLFIQLQHSAPTTGDIESSLLPTLTTMDSIDRKRMRPSRAATNRKTGYLSEMLLPTLMESDGDGGGGPNSYCRMLNKVARLLPTLRAGDAKQSAYQRDRGQKGKERLTLHGYAKLMPTLQAHDNKKGYAKRVGRFGTAAGGRNLADEVASGGTLDPIFCE